MRPTRFRGSSWAGWFFGFRRLWVDYRTGQTTGDRILTITWQGE